jgi:hypothetical protein
MFGANLTAEIVVVSPATESPSTDTPTPPTSPTAPPTDTPTDVPTDAPTAGPTPVSINPPASTSPYTERFTEETTMVGGGEASVTVECPAGTVVVGGGYSAGPDVLFNVQTKSGNGWHVYAVNTSGSSQTIRVYAVCLRNTVGTSASVVYRRITVKKNSAGGTVVHCPAGSVVTGGGWETEYVDVQVYASSPAVPGWSVMAYNGGSSDHPLYVYAVCVSGTGGITTGFDETVSIPGSSSGQTSVTCPPKALMTSGGFATGSGGDFMVHINSGPWGTNNEWRVYAVNISIVNRDLRAYATCLGFP